MAKITDEVLKLDIVVNGNKAQNELQKLVSKNAELRETQKSLQLQKAKLVAAGKKESEQYKRVTEDLKKTNLEFKENKKAQVQMRKQIGLTGLTTNQLVQEQRRLKRAVRDSVPGSDIWKKHRDDLKKVNSRLGEVSVGGSKVKAFFNDLGKGIGNVSPQLGGFLQSAKAGFTALLSPIGLVTGAIVGIVAAGKKWFDVNKEIIRTRKLVTSLTGETGKFADDIRIRAQVLRDEYGVELTESIETANSLAKNMEISFAEAFDIIENGAIDGKTNTNEFLDSLKEYPVQFKNAGFTAKEFATIVETGIDLGIYSDKLPDAIKEADLALKEQTKSTSEALKNAFGASFTNEILARVKSGETTTKQALIEIGEEAEKQNLSQQQYAQLTADVFKGAGEDAGGAKKIIEALTKSQENLNKPLTELQETRKQQLETERQLQSVYRSVFKLGSKGFETLLAKGKLFISEFLLKAILKGVDFINWFIDLNNRSNTFSAALVGLKKAATVPFRAIGILISAAIDQFKAFGNIVEGVFTFNFDKIKQGFIQQGEGIAQAIKKISEQAKNDVSEISSAFNGENQIQRVSVDAFLTEDVQVNKTENTKATNTATTNSLENENTGSDSLEKEDQRKLDSKKKLGLLLDQWQKEREEEERIKNFEKEEQEKEREIFDIEQKFQKLTEDANGEKELLSRLEAEKQAQIQSVTDKFAAEKLKKEQENNKKIAADKAKLNSEIINGAIRLAGSETKVGRSLIAFKQLMAAKESLIQLGVLKAKVATNIGKASADNAAGQAATAAVGFPQNIPLIAAFIGQTAGIISSISAAGKAKSTVKVPGFQDGKFPITRTDGKVFMSNISNDSGTQLVTEPTFFTDTNRIVGEVDPEIIIDGPTVKQLSPTVVNEIFSTANRVRGFEDGDFPTRQRINQVSEAPEQTDTTQDQENDDPMLMAINLNNQLLERLLDKGVKGSFLFGYDDLERLEELQEEKNQSDNNGILAQG